MNQLRDYIHSHHRQIVVLVVLFPLLLVGLYLALNPTAFRPKASVGSLKLDPATVSTKSNQDLVISLILDSASQEVFAGDVEIKYDPTFLQISSDSIVTTGFDLTPIKKVDANKGVITLAFAVSKSGSPFKTTATIATLPFKAKVSGSTTVLLGKSQFVGSTGQNVLENIFSQTGVTIDADDSSTGSGVPQAVYAFSPNPPQAGHPFIVTVRSLSGKVNAPALIVEGTEVRVTEGANNTYTWINGSEGPNLQAGKHIFQLAGGCKDVTAGGQSSSASKPNCLDANTGFNPYQLNLIDTTATPTPLASVTPSQDTTLDEVIANWGKAGQGDVNGDGTVDSRDYVLIFAK